jgi:RNA recognition motif-containing protein
VPCHEKAKLLVMQCCVSVSKGVSRDVFLDAADNLTNSFIIGRSRGFGFVTMSSGQEADAAIAGMHEQELDGRRIKVIINKYRRKLFDNNLLVYVKRLIWLLLVLNNLYMISVRKVLFS